jgi:hypothetical protein
MVSNMQCLLCTGTADLHRHVENLPRRLCGTRHCSSNDVAKEMVDAN